MPQTYSLNTLADLFAALDGNEDARDAYFNSLRGLRNIGAIAPDDVGTGARGGYGRMTSALARIAFVAFQVSGGREMPMLLARWLAERPVDPAAEYPVGETFTPPSRLDSIVERVEAGEAVTLTAELRHRKGASGLSWAFRVSEPEADTDLARAARRVRAETRAAGYEPRASIVLTVSDLIAPFVSGGL